MTHKDIHWIMSRYNHDNPEMWMSTSHISLLIGSCDVSWTRKELKKMEKSGLVRMKKSGSLMWSAIKKGGV